MLQKTLFLLLFPALLNAENYTFSGGKNNLAHIIAADVLVKAYAKAGISITPKFMNLEYSLKQSNSGITDGELARIRNIDIKYPNLKIIPVAVSSVQAIAFSKNTSLNIRNWNDLQHHSITIIKGAKFIEKETQHLTTNRVASFEMALELLNKNKTEIIVTPQLASLNLINKNKYQKIKAVSTSLKSLELFHFVHEKNNHLIPIITPILNDMKESGEITFIRQARLGKEIKKIAASEKATN